MAVLMPMRRPRLSSNTPPELPGLMAASVCMTLRIGTPRAPARHPAPVTLIKHSNLATGSLLLRGSQYDRMNFHYLWRVLVVEQIMWHDLEYMHDCCMAAAA